MASVRQIERVSITEWAGGSWSVHGGATFGGEHFNSAAEALAAVRERSQQLAGGSGMGVVVVDWYPLSDVGRTVVRVLSGDQDGGE